VRGLIGVAVLLAVASGAQVATSMDVRTALLATSAAAAVATLSRIVERRRPVRTVLVGDRVSVSTLAAAWQREPRVDLAGFAVLEPDLDPHEAADIYGIQAWTTFDGLLMAARTQDVDAVVVAPSPSFSSNDLRRLAWELEDSGVSLAVVSVLDSAAPARISTTALGGKTLHEVAPARPARSTALVKSLIDRSVGAALLVLAAPVLAAVVLAIRLDSAGPGLFAQERVGLRGKRFTMYKLRTMRRDAEDLKRALSEENDSDAVLFKMKQDPRVTRLGRLLRRSSLDELPQLINVVKGEMSLVGPRPALPDEVSQYDDQVRRRLAVKPGLTGLWQVSGRSDLPWDQAVRLDLYYADNVRVVEDLRIALRTVDAVLHSRGAY
jgi:exopolysaccharide biosynthesis polyprenyl glycosylphosphotransferase